MTEGRSERVQSIERAFQVLEILAGGGGLMGLSDIANESGYTQPTIHRALRTLVDLGYVRQEPSRQYGLGPRLIPLGERAVLGISAWARPLLKNVVDELGESANLAILEGDRVVYIAHVPSAQSVRMFTEVGSRTYPHCTGVGKALLAQMPVEDVSAMVTRTGMPAWTPNTITNLDDLLAELEAVRRQGFAVDREERELGVRCIAISVPESPTRLALSISGPSPRMGDAMMERSVPILRTAARAISLELTTQR